MLGQSFLPVGDREQAWKWGSSRVTGQDGPWQARKIILILSFHQLLSGHVEICIYDKTKFLWASGIDFTCETFPKQWFPKIWVPLGAKPWNWLREKWEENKLREREIVKKKKKERKKRKTQQCILNEFKIHFMSEILSEYQLCSERNVGLGVSSST